MHIEGRRGYDISRRWFEPYGSHIVEFNLIMGDQKGKNKLYGLGVYPISFDMQEFLSILYSLFESESRIFSLSFFSSSSFFSILSISGRGKECSLRRNCVVALNTRGGGGGAEGISESGIRTVSISHLLYALPSLYSLYLLQ